MQNCEQDTYSASAIEVTYFIAKPRFSKSYTKRHLRLNSEKIERRYACHLCSSISHINAQSSPRNHLYTGLWNPAVKVYKSASAVGRVKISKIFATGFENLSFCANKWHFAANFERHSWYAGTRNSREFLFGQWSDFRRGRWEGSTSEQEEALLL